MIALKGSNVEVLYIIKGNSSHAKQIYWNYFFRTFFIEW